LGQINNLTYSGKLGNLMFFASGILLYHRLDLYTTLIIGKSDPVLVKKCDYINLVLLFTTSSR